MNARYPADRNPMTSARRDYVHGPLHPMEQARIIARIGLVPALWLSVPFVAAILSIVAFAGGAS